MVSVMNHQEEWDYIKYRLENPNNALRCQNIDTHIFDLPFHIKRMKDYMDQINCQNAVDLKLLELDFEVSFKHVKEFMDREGWE